MYELIEAKKKEQAQKVKKVNKYFLLNTVNIIIKFEELVKLKIILYVLKLYIPLF